MLTALKKISIAGILILAVSFMSIWQSPQVALAEGLNTDLPEVPLYPGLSWQDLGASVEDIRININGDFISLPGERYDAIERFIAMLPQDVLDYYSNRQLAEAGWSSYDAYDKGDGTYFVFYHETGMYLSVGFLKCADDPGSMCISLWKSDAVDLSAQPSININKSPEVENQTTTTSTFGKISPANGATNINPTNVVLSWGAYTPTPDKYSYCVKEGTTCPASDPDWTSSYSGTSVTIPNLANGKTYYWQVKAITCVTCVPKTVVYADGGTFWNFKTKAATQSIIVGNAGVVGAVLSYTDGALKTVTADGYGNYLISVPIHWSGTVTPSKAGYVFSPKFASFTDLTAAQTIQNFTATPAYTISGSVSLSGVTLSYTDGTPQTVTSGSGGAYSIAVPVGWSGTVTPSKAGYTFLPASKSYSNLTSNKTGQDYMPLVEISGNTGVDGVTLNYTDGTPKSALSNGSGDYSIIVPWNWTGTVTPAKTGYTFDPVSRAYDKVKSSQTGQDYTAIDDPVVLSSVRIDESPTSAPSVDFMVTFSETVTGVDINDFAFTAAGLSGVNITNVNGSGAEYVVSVDTGSGSGTIRLDVIDDDTIRDLADHPLGGAGAGNGSFMAGQFYEVNMATLISVKAEDGFVIESSETSNVGGSLNKSGAKLNLGDNAANKQYRSILSFDTSILPDNAVITSVTLKFKYAGVSGTTPFNTHGLLLADVIKGTFKNNPALQLGDFNAKSTPDLYKAKVLSFTNTMVDNWYSQSFLPDDFGFINLGGSTQIRLRFAKDDNNDFGADFLKIYSGNALNEADRPQLIVEFSVP